MGVWRPGQAARPEIPARFLDADLLVQPPSASCRLGLPNHHRVQCHRTLTLGKCQQGIDLDRAEVSRSRMREPLPIFNTASFGQGSSVVCRHSTLSGKSVGQTECLLHSGLPSLVN